MIFLYVATLLICYLCIVHGLLHSNPSIKRNHADNKVLFAVSPRGAQRGETDLEKEMTSIISPNPDFEISSLLESMPLKEKYTLLLQSYSSKILENEVTDRITALTRMKFLFGEMLQAAITPERKAAKALIDASASFCNVAIMGKALRHIKAGRLDRAV